jgi:hypothetical protein
MGNPAAWIKVVPEVTVKVTLDRASMDIGVLRANGKSGGRAAALHSAYSRAYADAVKSRFEVILEGEDSAA